MDNRKRPKADANVCPRCKRPRSFWPLARPNRCSPKDWVKGIRNS